MKLLFDEHLSPKLAKRLQDIFPGSNQVDALGLKGSDDHVLHEFAKTHGFILVSKDDDFYDLALARGYPPKVVILRTGNQTTDQLEMLLRRIRSSLEEFASLADSVIFELLD